MARCSNVMQALRDEFPPLLASLESIIDTMLRDLKENWCETLLRDMRGIIRQLHVIQYKNRLDECTFLIQPSVRNFAGRNFATRL